MTTLVQYVRNEDGSPKGVVVAVGKNQVGWSLCHTKDQWDKDKGKLIATGRAMAIHQAEVPAIGRISEVMEKVRVRANQYFG